MEAYEPLVFQMMLKCGLQPADATEQTQEVMTAVAKSIRNWEPDEARGKFRTWLFRIAKNILADYWRRLNRKPLTGLGSGVLEELESDGRNSVIGDSAKRPETFQEEFDEEFQKRVFALAASKIKSRVQSTTWQAFWYSAVEQKPVEEIAQRLDVPVANVYVAKSRVMKQLQEEVKLFLAKENER